MTVSGNRLLALAHLTALDARPPELVSAAADAGFGAVGLRLHPPRRTDPFDPVIGDEPLLRETVRRLRATGLSVLEVEAVWLQPGTRLDDLLPVLETGARLGAQYLLTVGHDPDPNRLLDSFSALGVAAARYGMTLALEFIPYCHVGTLAAARRLIGDAGLANAKVLIDALHLFRSGAQPGELASIAPDEFAYLQLCDAPRAAPPDSERRAEAITGRLLPGEGELPLADLLQRLPPAAPISVEAPCKRLAGLPAVERARAAMAATRLCITSNYG